MLLTWPLKYLFGTSVAWLPVLQCTQIHLSMRPSSHKWNRYMKQNSTVFWDFMPSSFVDGYERFKLTCCLQLQDNRLDLTENNWCRCRDVRTGVVRNRKKPVAMLKVYFSISVGAKCFVRSGGEYGLNRGIKMKIVVLWVVTRIVL